MARVGRVVSAGASEMSEWLTTHLSESDPAIKWPGTAEFTWGPLCAAQFLAEVRSTNTAFY